MATEAILNDSKSKHRLTRLILLIGAAVVVIAGVGVGIHLALTENSEKQQQEKAEQLAQKVGETQSIEPIREAVDKGEITENQARNAMRDFMIARIDSVAKEYFALPEDQKVAFLDKQINQFEAMRKRFQRQREERTEDERQRDEERQPADTDSKSREERMMAFLDGTDPAVRNRIAEFMRIASERRKERGLPDLRGPRDRSGDGRTAKSV